jgi:hypothetical protein
MKSFLFIFVFFAAAFCTTSLWAQTDLSFVLDKTNGSLSIFDANKTDVTAQYKVNTAEFDIYLQTQYVGSIQLEKGKIAPEELGEKEVLHVVKMQLVHIASGKTIDINQKKPAIIVTFK